MTIEVVNEIATETKYALITTVPGFVTAAEIISQLRAEYDGVIPDVSNPLAMAKTVAARKKFRDAYVALDKAKPEIKREALEFCKTVESDYKSLRVACVEFFDVFDTAIKAEEGRKEAIKEQQKIEAAAAQKVLDDKIIEIGKLPLRCIGQTSDEITLFIAALDAKPIGGEFTGDTRKRAEDAKEEAITAIREMLAATIKAEGIAATLKAEQEAEAVRLEAERLERERLAAIENKRLADERAVNDEQKRLNDIESARLAELAKVEQKRLDDERAIFEAEKAEVAKKQAEDDRIAAAKQAELQKAIDEAAAIEKRVQDEEAAKQRELDRQAAIVAERNRIEAEKARKVAEKKAKLLAARCDNAEVALVKILQLCREDESGNTTLAEIALIAEASI